MEKRILIIEDDPDSRELICEVLLTRDLVPLASECADEAITTLKANTDIGLVITDLALPGGGRNGEIVRVIRDAGFGHLPIILLSGHMDLPQIAKGLNVKYLRKPFEMNDLFKVIDSVVA